VAVRKIDLMHREFGICPGYKCKNCSNFIKVMVSDMPLSKCKVYGVTASAASDWAQKYEACGMFNMPYKGKPIIRMVKPNRHLEEDDTPLEGQLSLMDGE